VTDEAKKTRSAPRQEALRKRREAEGLKRLELWAHKDDHQSIKDHATTLAANRKKAAAKKARKPKQPKT
jgi:hypothetical protein